MKPHIRKVRGIWTVRMCERVSLLSMPPKPFWKTVDHVVGHGYTVREACEDWKAQMQAQRA